MEIIKTALYVIATSGVLLLPPMVAEAQTDGGATLYKCVGVDGVPSYVSKPIAGKECVAIGRYVPNRPSIFASPPSILDICRDPNNGSLASPSARAKECTRVYCGTAEMKSKIRLYALSKAQPEADQREALTCLTRRDQDEQRRR